MKKRALFLAMVAALVAFAACNKEAAGPLSEEGAVEAVFEVSAPELATKAISDGLTATKLFFYLYDKNGDLLFNTDSSVLPAANAYPVTFDKLEDKKWSVKVRLIKDMQYQVVFWAQKPDADAFTLDAAAKTLSVNYINMTLNADDEDAFWGTTGVFTVDGPATKVVTLKRPFAQLNVAIPAEDLAVAAFTLDKYGKSAGDIETNYTLSSNAYTTMKLLDGAVADNVTAALTFTAAKQPNTNITIGDKTYKHMAMAYVLVGSEKVINDVTLTVNTGAAAIGAEGVLTRNVLNVPLQRNYRTNIIGSIFSVEEEFKVEIDNEFGETGTGAYGDVNVPDYVPTFNNIAALNAELAKGVNAVALDMTAVAGTINLPNTTEDIYLYILNDLSAAGNVINVVYTEGAAAHPANLYIYAKNLNTLNGTVPDTHVEIYSYSHIGTGVMETSGTTLVIQPFAFYGNLVIRKGGLRIEGRKDAETGEYEKDKDNKEAKGIVASVVINVPAGEQAPIVNDGLLGDESTTDNTAVTVESGTTAITGEGTVEGDVEAKGENTVVTVATEVKGEVNVSDSANVTVTTEVDVNNDGGTVSAGDGYVYDETTKEVVSAVAQNDTKYYLSLADAVAEAQEGDTINLLRDDETSLTGGGEIEINKSLTITGAKDDKGNPLYTIFGTSTVTGTNDIFITGSGTVTLSNLKVKNFGNNANSDANHSPVYVSKNFTGTVNLNNIYVSNFNRGGIFLYGGTFNVEDCYIDCANSRSGAFTKGIEIKGSANGTIKDTFICNMERNSADSTAGIEIYGNGSIVVENCTIVSDDDNHQSVKATYGIVSSRVGVHNPSGGSTLVKDCMFSCTNGCLSISDSAEYGPVNNYSFTVTDCDFDNYIATWSATSSITINGGSFAEDVYADAGTITIHGGEFTNFAPSTDTGSIIIDGGTFDADPSAYVASGYKVEMVGENYVVVVDDAVWNGTAIAEPSLDGTTYNISTAAELAWVATQVYEGVTFEGKTVKMLNNVDLNGQEWITSSGGHYVQREKATIKDNGAYAFRGIFDGNNKTISGLTISGNYADEVSLGFLGGLYGASFKDVTFDDVDIDISGSAQVGAVCGLNYNSVIDNVTVNGIIHGYQAVGGIAGRILQIGTIKNCVNNAEVSGTSYNVGGITGIGYLDSADPTSGVANTQIQNCTNNGNVTSGGNAAGGIAALFYGDISGCANTGNVSSTQITGGITAESRAGSIKNCSNSGAISGTSGLYAAGGIVGWIRYNQAVTYATYVSIEGCSNTGNVSGASNAAGGIAGLIYFSAVVKDNVCNALSISGSEGAAGIVGNYYWASNVSPTSISYTEEEKENFKLTLTGNTVYTPVTITATHTDNFVYNSSGSSHLVSSDNVTVAR